MGLWSGTDAPLALIAGGGDYPSVFAEAFAPLKKKLVVIGVEGLTDKRIGRLASEVHYLGLGDLEKLFALLKEHKIKQVVLAGSIPKKEIYNPSFKPDRETKDFIQGVTNKGDDHLLRAFGLLLKVRCGVSVMDPRGLLKDVLAAKGILTRRAPTAPETADLKFGFRIAKDIGRMDIGQAVVVKNGVVLAVEALEGTNEAIRRGGALAADAAVVKVSKPKQDLRFDMPCVGLETLSVMKENRIHVLGVEAGKTLMLKKDELVRKADEAGLTIVGL